MKIFKLNLIDWLANKYIISLLFLISFSNLLAQNTAPKEDSDYVLSSVRALERYEKEQEASHKAQEASLQSRGATPTPRGIAPITKMSRLVELYTSNHPDYNFKLIKDNRNQDNNNMKGVSLPNVKYFMKGSSGAITDDYNFFTGTMDMVTPSGDENPADGKLPATFKHASTVAKFINGRYRMTTYGYSRAEPTMGYNVLTEAWASDTELKGKRLMQAPGFGDGGAVGFTTYCYLEKDLPAVGNRSASKEIILLSISPDWDATHTYKNTSAPTGVLETRMYPDDYIPTIHTEHKFHFTENTQGSAYFAYQIDSKFGSNDFVPVYRQANKRGMFMEAEIDGNKYRYNYTIPAHNNLQEIQYSAQSYRDPFYKAFNNSRFGNGAESKAGDGELMIFAGKNPPPTIKDPTYDSGMFFKDKGKKYLDGEVASYTLVQGVAEVIRPELEFNGAQLHFESPKGIDFDMKAHGMKWIDTNDGVSVSNNEGLSKGGKVSFVKMYGTFEIPSTKREVVCTYSKQRGQTEGEFKDTDYTSNDHTIPASLLDLGRNVFKFTITNDVWKGGSWVQISNHYIVTITTFNAITTNVVYKDQFNNILTPPLSHQDQTSFSGREGNTLIIKYPQTLDGYIFQRTDPDLSPTQVGSDMVTVSTYNSTQTVITAIYKTTKVPLIIRFRHLGDNNNKIYKDIDINTNYVEDYPTSLEPGANIESYIKSLILAGNINLNIKGYQPVNVANYKVLSGVKPITMPSQATTIIYEYTGVLTNF